MPFPVMPLYDNPRRREITRRKTASRAAERNTSGVPEAEIMCAGPEKGSGTFRADKRNVNRHFWLVLAVSLKIDGSRGVAFFVRSNSDDPLDRVVWREPFLVRENFYAPKGRDGILVPAP